MSRVRALPTLRQFLTLLAVVAVMHAAGYAQTARSRRIAGFGSSVAFGTGDEYGKEGYTGLLRAMLAPKGWEVLNQSRGGDTTKLLATRWAPEGAPDSRTRYLLPVNPAYVVIGLSLANEGIFEAGTKEEKDAVFQQYADGMRGFVAKARQQNIVPIVTLCYPRSVYTAVDYDYIRRMNILENSWDVPSVNFLGALDDGHGRWARGFMFNDKHPNAAGHRELALAFVPTLFDALEKGKPTPSKPQDGRGFARIVQRVCSVDVYGGIDDAFICGRHDSEDAGERPAGRHQRLDALGKDGAEAIGRRARCRGVRGSELESRSLFHVDHRRREREMDLHECRRHTRDVERCCRWAMAPRRVEPLHGAGRNAVFRRRKAGWHCGGASSAKPVRDRRLRFHERHGPEGSRL